MTDALTSHLVSGTPELQFAIDEVPTAEAVATVVHVVQSEPSAADRGLEVLAALADDEAKYWRDPPGLAPPRPAATRPPPSGSSTPPSSCTCTSGC